MCKYIQVLYIYTKKGLVERLEENCFVTQVLHTEWVYGEITHQNTFWQTFWQPSSIRSRAQEPVSTFRGIHNAFDFLITYYSFRVLKAQFQ